MSESTKDSIKGEDRSTHRVNVNFSDEAYKELTEMARRRNKTLSDVLRDALALEKWYEEAKEEGSKVLVERKNGRMREVLRP